MCVVAGGGGMPSREDRAGCWGGPKGQFKGPQFHTATKSPRENPPLRALAVRDLVWVEIQRF